jgi:hypothetical protein
MLQCTPTQHNNNKIIIKKTTDEWKHISLSPDEGQQAETRLSDCWVARAWLCQCSLSDLATLCLFICKIRRMRTHASWGPHEDEVTMHGSERMYDK